MNDANSAPQTKPAGDDSPAGFSRSMNHYIETNFGIHSFSRIPSVLLITDNADCISLTQRFLDNLSLPSGGVLVLHYRANNGLVQCFQIIDSVETWLSLAKQKVKICGLYSIDPIRAMQNCSTFNPEKVKLTFHQKIECPRCNHFVEKRATLLQHCHLCNTRFTSGTK